MTHIKFKHSGKEYNFALPINTDAVQKTEVITNDKMFVVSVEMAKNIINVYEVTEEIFESYSLVHTQPIKKAVLKATDFLEWYLEDHDTLFDLALDFVKVLKKNGSLSINVFELFKSCGYIPENICTNVKDSNYNFEYDIEEIILFDDYQEEPKYYLL